MLGPLLQVSLPAKRRRKWVVVRTDRFHRRIQPNSKRHGEQRYEWMIEPSAVFIEWIRKLDLHRLVFNIDIRTERLGEAKLFDDCFCKLLGQFLWFVCEWLI